MPAVFAAAVRSAHSGAETLAEELRLQYVGPGPLPRPQVGGAGRGWRGSGLLRLCCSQRQAPGSGSGARWAHVSCRAALPSRKPGSAGVVSACKHPILHCAAAGGGGGRGGLGPRRCERCGGGAAASGAAGQPGSVDTHPALAAGDLRSTALNSCVLGPYASFYYGASEAATPRALREAGAAREERCGCHVGAEGCCGGCLASGGVGGHAIVHLEGRSSPCLPVPLAGH